MKWKNGMGLLMMLEGWVDKRLEGRETQRLLRRLQRESKLLGWGGWRADEVAGSGIGGSSG